MATTIAVCPSFVPSTPYSGETGKTCFLYFQQLPKNQRSE
jgi:hypothetical protein